MRNVNPIYIKVVGDALLPILGYFFWDWNVYFILIFYILDLLVGEFLVHMKTRKIKYYSDKVVVSSWIKHGTISFALILLCLLIIHVAMKIVDPNIVFMTEIFEFISYEEMGIAQGYVLLPLIVLIGYSQYKNEFILPKQFRTLEFSKLWKTHLLSRLLICVLAVSLWFIAYLIHPIEWVYILAIILSTSAYQLQSLRN